MALCHRSEGFVRSGVALVFVYTTDTFLTGACLPTLQEHPHLLLSRCHPCPPLYLALSLRHRCLLCATSVQPREKDAKELGKTRWRQLQGFRGCQHCYTALAMAALGEGGQDLHCEPDPLLPPHYRTIPHVYPRDRTPVTCELEHWSTALHICGPVCRRITASHFRFSRQSDDVEVAEPRPLDCAGSYQ